MHDKSFFDILFAFSLRKPVGRLVRTNGKVLVKRYKKSQARGAAVGL